MIYTTIFLALVAPILAQSDWTLPAGFNPGVVDSTTRSNWCLAQRNNCPLVCGGAASDNRCDSDTLEFTCTCSNGTDANVAIYQGTIPFFVCEQEFGLCMQQSHTQDGDDECTANREQCGSLNASAPTSASSTSTTSTTLTSETSTSTSDNQGGSGGSEPTTTDSSDSPTETGAAFRLMQSYGLAGFATVIVAAFALL